MEQMGPKQYPKRETAEFFGDLADSFDLIQESVERVGLTHHSVNGYPTIIHTIPNELLAHMPSYKRDVIQASLSGCFTSDQNANYVADRLIFELEDGAVIRYDFEDMFTTVYINEEVVLTKPSRDMIDSALGMILPADVQQRDTDPIIKTILDEETVDTTKTTFLELGNDAFIISEIEAPNDSHRSIQIRSRYPHIGGSVIEIEAVIEQSLSNMHTGIDTTRRVALCSGLPIPITAYTHIIDGKRINIDKPSRQHVDIIRGAVERLFELTAAVEL